jgi:hypothetical protein
VAPEIVGLAEGFSQRVYFIPVSSLGRMPEFDEKKSIIGIKPAHLSPIWAEVPFLLQLHLNDLLQAACLTDETIPYITQYKFQGSHIMFGFPDTNERYTLPSFYCNKTVYCETTKKYYRLPNYPKVETQVEDVNTQEFANQDFWAN